MKYFVSKEILASIAEMPQTKIELGTQTYEELQEYMEKLAPYERLQVVLGMISNLETLDPILDRVTTMGVTAIAEEKYTNAEFEESTADTVDSSYTIALQNLVYTARDYGLAVTVTDKMVAKNPDGIVEDLIAQVYVAYRKLLRRLKIEALMRRPVAEAKETPCLWRRTANFALDEDKVKPHPNGFLTFDLADEDDWAHYRYHTAIDKEIFDDAIDILNDKGYGKGQIWVIASRNFFKTFKNLFSKEDLEVIKLRREVSGIKFDEIDEDVVYIELPNSDFPQEYYIVLDPNVRGLYGLYDPELDGLRMLFNNLGELRTSKMAEFKRYSIGYGIREKGFAVVGYVKADATDYVNPSFRTAIQ